MKKLLTCLLTLLLVIPTVGVIKSEEVSAEGLSACGLDYEVDYINDDGSFTSKGCYSSFSEAKSKMKELGGDHVVRQAQSMSPSKIIAMNSGYAYSYPGRNSSKTLDIYQSVSDRSAYYKKTYITNHYAMYYEDTERYFISNGVGVGMIKVAINGFEGYTDYEYTDLVPSKFLNNGIALYLGGYNSYENEDAFLVKPEWDYYEIKQDGNYTDLVFHFSRAYPSSGTNPTRYSITEGPAPSFMKAGTKYYSKDGINFYTDTNLTNYAGTYYNYYQYLPIRSKTDISASTLNSFISSKTGSVMLNSGQTFIDAQNTYGVNALLLFAMACHESAYGLSSYAVNRNNLFGWNAHDDSPSDAASFSSVTTCINEQAGINLRGFVDITDGRFFSSSLGSKGSGMNVKYASDPYWGAEIAALAYQIDKYANGYNGNLTDYNKYSLAVINTFDIPVKSSASDSSTTLYTTQYGPYYQKDFIVITLGTSGSYTKIQSTNAIDDNGNIKTHRTPITTGNLNPISTYDYDKSVAYVKTSYLNAINTGSSNTTKVVEDVPDKELSLMSSIDSITLSNGNLNISGCAFIKGMSFKKLEDVKHTVVLCNVSDNSEYKSYTATTSSYPGIKFNDNHTYTYVGFNVSIPLSDITSGNYYLKIKVDNSTYSYNGALSSYIDSVSNISYVTNNLNYHLTTNETYSYRFELDVASLPSVIDYTSVSKPSTRYSMFSFDTLTLDEEVNMNIYGQSLIYYTNFDTKENITYTVYLVKDADTFYSFNAETKASNYDYKTLLSSSYNMDYICYDGSYSLKDLPVGTYKMILKITNGSNVDFVEMRNSSGITLPSVTYNSKTYTFSTSNVRDSLILEVA